MSEAYNFLFSNCNSTSGGMLKTHNFREQNREIVKTEDEDSFAVNPMEVGSRNTSLNQRRRMSTKSDDASGLPFNFSFQLDNYGNESEFPQNKFHLVDKPANLWKEDPEEGFYYDDQQKIEQRMWPEKSGVTESCILLEDQIKQDGLKHIQRDPATDDRIYNCRNDELDFSSFQNSFETFAIPDSKEHFLQAKDQSLFAAAQKDESDQTKELCQAKKPEKGRGKKRKTKTNSFALGRTWFRGMSNYYKNKFEPLLKQWEKDISNPGRLTMDQLITDFIRKEFNDCQYSVASEEFLDMMVSVLHSQNYKKNDDYIKRRDFKRIRSLLYCYSSSAKKNFISDRCYAIIFQNFLKKARDEFLCSKAKVDNPEFRDELNQELEDIYYLSLAALKDSQ